VRLTMGRHVSRGRTNDKLVIAMERLLVAKAVAGSPDTMGHPIRRVRVPSLSANFN